MTRPNTIQTHSRGESLDAYRTIAFGIETMRDGIQISRVFCGQIDASVWWSIVPEIYRPHVEPVVDRVTGEFILRGSKLNAESLYEFVQAMNDAIWRQVKPQGVSRSI